MRARIDHVGIVVPELEPAIEWYTGAFGWSVRWREPETDVSDVLIGLPGQVVRLRGAMLDAGGVGVELHEYLYPTGAGGRRVCDRGLGHLAVESVRIEDDWQELGGQGVRWNGPPAVIGAGPLVGRRWVYGIDPFGIVVELCQHPEVGR